MISRRDSSRITFALGTSIIALLISLVSFWRFPSSTSHPSTTTGILENIDRTGAINVGYGIYPPYSQEDPISKQVSGFSVDIIKEIAKELGVKVVWHRINWNTMSADLQRGEFDVIADPIFQTIPRARELAFTEPYAYFGTGIAIIRKGDHRFTNFDSLDLSGIVVAAGQGSAEETLAKNRLVKPQIVSVSTANDLLQPFNDVISGRADVAIADRADAKRFLQEHPSTVQALWLDHPPAVVPAGFALRFSDREGAEFLTVCLRNLKSMGIIDALQKKYHLSQALQ
ncbi:MAG TPA: transporter substrate-binding domain-containing protein [Candidatus Baltobacteraceae bacterium]|nr:transporter substrate-binding domain-containing protein [Candidatus Baltobacteraceae bacterium]